MRVLVCARSDEASVNIRDNLLKSDEWSKSSTFREAPTWQRGDDILIEIAGPSITDEQLTIDLQSFNPRAVWFLSRHRAASGQPSLTVHPIGNFAAAKFGGADATLSPVAPRDMGALLRRLRHHRDAMQLPHQVTYEATHHGPLMLQPSLFVELGSDEEWYEDQASGEALAAAIHDVLDGEGFVDAPICVGVGGGHYVPRMTDKALAGEADFAHLVPAYAVEAAGKDALDLARDASGEAEIYVHKKGLKGPERQLVQEWL